MKKTFALGILFLLICATFTGCDGGTPRPEQVKPESQPWTTAAQKPDWPVRDMTFADVTFGSGREWVTYRMGREPDTEDTLDGEAILFYHVEPAYVHPENGEPHSIPGSGYDVTFYLQDDGVYRIDLSGESGSGFEMTGREQGDGTLAGVLAQYGGPNAVDRDGDRYTLWYYSPQDADNRLWFEAENGELTYRMGIVRARNDSTPAPLADDEAEMLRVIAAGKQFVAALQRGEHPAHAEYEDEQDAVAAFERFFRMDTLHVSGVFIHPNMPDSYICMISGSNEFNNARSVKVSFFPGDPMSWYCSLVEYAAMIDWVTELYIGYLRDNDAYSLAAWLAVDAPPSDELVREAEATLEYINRLPVDLSEARIRDALIVESGSYLSGEGFWLTVADASGYSFEVELVCGHGQCRPRLPRF